MPKVLLLPYRRAAFWKNFALTCQYAFERKQFFHPQDGLRQLESFGRAAFWQNFSLTCQYAFGRKQYAVVFVREFVSNLLSVKPLAPFFVQGFAAFGGFSHLQIFLYLAF